MTRSVSFRGEIGTCAGNGVRSERRKNRHLWNARPARLRTSSGGAPV